MNLFLILLIVIVMVVGYNYFKSKGSFQSVTAADVAQLKADNPKLVFVDVRTPGEVSGGKINKALEINVQSPEFSRQIEKLPKDQPYVVYCRSGGRSAMACNIMAKQGFEQLYNLQGGYSAWPSR